MEYLIRKLKTTAMMLEMLTDKQKEEFAKRYNVDQITANVSQLSNNLYNSIGAVKNAIPDTESQEQVQDRIE
jgi:DNA recombination-dependent growth factor C